MCPFIPGQIVCRYHQEPQTQDQCVWLLGTTMTAVKSNHLGNSGNHNYTHSHNCPFPCKALLVLCSSTDTPGMCPSTSRWAPSMTQMSPSEAEGNTDHVTLCPSKTQSHIPILSAAGSISTDCTLQCCQCWDSQQNSPHRDFIHKFLFLETNVGKYCIPLTGKWWIRQPQRMFWLCPEAVVLFAFRFRQLLSQDLQVPFVLPTQTAGKVPWIMGSFQSPERLRQQFKIHGQLRKKKACN